MGGCCCDEDLRQDLAQQAAAHGRAADDCTCTGCRYPNGPWQVVCAQLLLLAGALLGGASMTDCEFVVATTLVPVPFEGVPFLDANDVNYTLSDRSSTILLPPRRRGLGFFFNETIPHPITGDGGGECPYDEDFTDDQIEDYIDFLGGDWRVARGMGLTALGIAWLSWLFWLMIFPCVAHIRALRYFMAALLILVVLVFQCVTFHVLNTDFCDRANCDFGRSAWFGIGAVLAYLFAAICLIFMRDYPGRPRGAAAMSKSLPPQEPEEHNEEVIEEVEPAWVEETEEEDFAKTGVEEAEPLKASVVSASAPYPVEGGEALYGKGEGGN